jgi:hypothetical protein
MSTGRLHSKSTASWLKPAVVQVDLSKVQPALKNFIKALAILVFGLLLHILIDFSKNADTRNFEYSNAEKGLQANLSAGENENTVIEMTKFTGIK